MKSVEIEDEIWGMANGPQNRRSGDNIGCDPDANR